MFGRIYRTAPGSGAFYVGRFLVRTLFSLINVCAWIFNCFFNECWKRVSFIGLSISFKLHWLAKAVISYYPFGICTIYIDAISLILTLVG